MYQVGLTVTECQMFEHFSLHKSSSSLLGLLPFFPLRPPPLPFQIASCVPLWSLSSPSPLSSRYHYLPFRRLSSPRLCARCPPSNLLSLLLSFLPSSLSLSLLFLTLIPSFLLYLLSSSLSFPLSLFSYLFLLFLLYLLPSFHLTNFL